MLVSLLDGHICANIDVKGLHLQWSSVISCGCNDWDACMETKRGGKIIDLFVMASSGRSHYSCMHADKEYTYMNTRLCLFLHIPDFKQQYHMHLFDHVCHILHLSHTSHICQIRVFGHISQISQICQLFHINLFVQISQTCLFVCFFRFVYSYLCLRSVS